MIAPVTSMRSEIGRSSAIVVVGPSPGSTPTMVPRNAPSRQSARLSNVRRTPKPWRRPSNMALQDADALQDPLCRAVGELHLQRRPEQEDDRSDQGERITQGRQPRAALREAKDRQDRQ